MKVSDGDNLRFFYSDGRKVFAERNKQRGFPAPSDANENFNDLLVFSFG